MDPRRNLIFVSYALEDRKIVDRILGALRELAPDAAERLFDPERSILPGENRHTAVGAALSEAGGLVFFASPRALESPWCLSELQYATAHPRFKDRVLPVVLGAAVELPTSLRSLRQVRYEREALPVARELAKWLGAEARVGAREPRKGT